MPAPIRLMVFEGYQPGYGFYNAFGALQRPLLQRGSTGSFVVEAQKALMNVLQRSLRAGADGQFGSETETAVRDAQAQFGLPVTGQVDADTWTLLLGQEVQLAPAAAAGGGTPTGGGTPAPIPQKKDQPIDNGNIVVGQQSSAQKKDNTMLYGALALAVVGGLIFLTGKKK